jgi:arsenate reductase
MPETTKWTILHNPRCSKSRLALELLKKNKIEPEVREYLKAPLTKDEIESLLKKLNLSASELLRKKEKIIEENQLDVSSDEKILECMVKHPVLIERPVVVKNDRAVIGRPPENVAELLAF